MKEKHTQISEERQYFKVIVFHIYHYSNCNSIVYMSVELQESFPF